MPRATTVSMQTPPGRGGIAVLALCGPRAGEILDQVFCSPRAGKPAGSAAWQPLQHGQLVHRGEALDEAVVCRRGDTIEINLHGGPHLVRRAVEALAELGATPLPADAAPPALATSHPAWNNPAIGVEMLAAIAHAHSELALTAVASQWSAGLSELAARSLELVAQPSQTGSVSDLTKLAERLREAARGLESATRLLRPAEVVLAGPPNAGKSSLANALWARPASVVHERAGTTRDYVRELAVLHDVPVWLTDTAGLLTAERLAQSQPAHAAIDRQADGRARNAIERADVVVWLQPADHSDAAADQPTAPPRASVIHVASKCDLHPPAGRCDVQVSSLTGQGLDDLKASVVNALGLSGFDPNRPMAFTSRQAQLLTAAADHLLTEPTRAARALAQLLRIPA